MRHESQISINGAVAQPLLLSLTSLMAMECQKVQCNDISRAGEYRGIFNYRGVPLQELLRPARIKKLDEAFKKPVDLAIVVKNRAGEKSVLSWGEIFTASPATSFSRLAAARCSPAIPTATAATRNRFTLSDSPPLQRTVSYPKLVISGDHRADRCLEGISEISVVEFPAHAGDRKLDPLHASTLKIFGDLKKPQSLTTLPSQLARWGINIFQVGDGRLYHGPGEYTFTGVGLVKLLTSAGISSDLNAVVMIWSPDGYRALFSLGELLLGREGDSFLLAVGEIEILALPE
ncbi:MAG TPA: hypothetical protein ENN66_06275 [Proteobacteria bacterium]|nr:hypothetical protein [Pseudomonadota bacterium]